MDNDFDLDELVADPTDVVGQIKAGKPNQKNYSREPTKQEIEAGAPVPSNDAYETWRRDQSPTNMGALLQSVQPTIRSAVKSHAGGDPAMMGYARLLATKAIRKYDPSRGAKLTTYLHTQLQPLQRRFLQRSNMTSAPQRVQIERFRLSQAEDEHRQVYGREPSEQEIADKLGVNMKRLRHIRSFGRGAVPESTLTDPEGGLQLPGVDRTDPEQIWIEYIHHDLNPIDRRILEWKTGMNGETLGTSAIARKLGITPGAVTQRAARISRALDRARIERGQAVGQEHGVRV
jgi:DNA-directed RNA polymerase specialized sigma subunit